MDFSRQQIDALSSGNLEESIRYWMRELDPIPSVLPLLPIAQTRSRKVRRAYGNHTVGRELSSRTVRRVKEASQACRATPMQFDMAAVQALFARLLGIEDMCIGVTDAGRANGEFANAIGHFTNLLPMRFSPNKEQSFAELVSETSRTILNGLEHAQVPIDMILEKLDMQRSSAYTPLYQVAFNYRIGDLLQRTLGNCTMDLIQYEDTKKPYDLTFNITQTSEGGGHFVEVCSGDYLYSAAATEMVMNTFIGLLESASFAFPDAVAIKDDEGSMTYTKLAGRVSALAEALINSGVGLDSRLAVLCRLSNETYVAMLAILYIEAVYVPLDMSLPAARHRAMVSVCKPDLLIFHSATTSAATQCVGEGKIATLNLSELATMSAQARQPPLAAAVRDSFLLFTSGSTGTPKGIRLSQSGLMNYAALKSAKLGLGQVKVLQQSSTGFDMSIAQALNAFANAGTLVVAPLTARGDPVLLAQLMVDEAIEFTICTPLEYNLLVTYAADILRQCKSWRHACSGGESVVDALVSELQRLELPDLTLTDCYSMALPRSRARQLSKRYLCIRTSKALERPIRLAKPFQTPLSTSLVITARRCLLDSQVKYTLAALALPEVILIRSSPRASSSKILLLYQRTLLRAGMSCIRPGIKVTYEKMVRSSSWAAPTAILLSNSVGCASSSTKSLTSYWTPHRAHWLMQ